VVTACVAVDGTGQGGGVPRIMVEASEVAFGNLGAGCCGAPTPGVGPIRKIKTTLDKCGLFRCCPSLGPQILQITLLSVANAPNAGFYIEVTARPESGQPKISRIHASQGPVVDLNDELLELDWFGDEKEVIIHLMGVSGHLQSSDVPAGELRIPGSVVRRYAQEASGYDDDFAYGSRRFVMPTPEESELVKRKRRFQDTLIPDGSRFAERIAETVFNRTGEDLGLDMVNAEEMEALKQENHRLRDKHSHLSSQAAQSGVQTDSPVRFKSQLNQSEAAIVLTVHFQLVSKRHMAKAARGEFRKASFQVDAD